MKVRASVEEVDKKREGGRVRAISQKGEKRENDGVFIELEKGAFELTSIKQYHEKGVNLKHAPIETNRKPTRGHSCRAFAPIKNGGNFEFGCKGVGVAPLCQ